MSGADADRPERAHAASPAFLFGNFVIGCGVLVVPGMLNELAATLQVSVPTAGQLLGLAALAMCIGAPLGAAFTSRIDRRKLLVSSLLLYCAGHAACALADDYATLALLRPISVLGAAIFTPQAAATIGLLVPAQRRASAVTTIFLGWSIASVAGMPLGSLIAGYLNWRGGFVLVAVLSALAAVWVARVVPAGLTVPALSRSSWIEVARSPRLTLVLAVTLISSSAQFTVLAYIAPSLRQTLGASPAVLAALLAVNGVFGVIGNTLMSRRIARIGPDRSVWLGLLVLTLGLGVWAVAITAAPAWPVVTLGMALWGLGAFASNSAQQARLAASAPALASASIALNTACMYAGQSVGAALGGATVAAAGYWPLGWCALGLMLAALAASRRADRLTGPARP